MYFVEAVGADVLKIGTAVDVGERLATLQCGNHCELRLVRVCGGGRTEEDALHKLYAPHRVRGEWFRRSAIYELVMALPATLNASRVLVVRDGVPKSQRYRRRNVLQHDVG